MYDIVCDYLMACIPLLLPLISMRLVLDYFADLLFGRRY